MITINGELCYSPQPPEAYSFPPLGHGLMCRGDIQVWNLAFLSYPELDGYLTADDKLAYTRSLPPTLLASVKAALNGENGKRIFPDLRDALRRAPHLFLEDLWRMKWELMPMYLDDPKWVDVIQARAAAIDTDTRIEAVLAVTHRDGNVVNVDFGIGATPVSMKSHVGQSIRAAGTGHWVDAADELDDPQAAKPLVAAPHNFKRVLDVKIEAGVPLPAIMSDTGINLVFSGMKAEAREDWVRLITKNKFAVILLNYLTDKAGSTGIVAVGQRTLARTLDVSPKTIQRSIAALTEENFIKVIQLNGAGTVPAFVLCGHIGWENINGQNLSVFPTIVIADGIDQDEETRRSFAEEMPGEAPSN